MQQLQQVMQHVNIKSFQANMYSYLDKLPLVITKRGKPVFEIHKANQNLNKIAVDVDLAPPVISKKRKRKTSKVVSEKKLPENKIESVETEVETETESSEKKKDENLCQHGFPRMLCKQCMFNVQQF